MDDLRKAAEMALEALKQYTDVVQSGTDPRYRWHEVIDGGAPARKAIKALHQALEQPKREWVGLTKKEIDFISERVKPDPLMTEEPTWHIRFAQALQRKLKEKNT